MATTGVAEAQAQAKMNAFGQTSCAIVMAMILAGFPNTPCAQALGRIKNTYPINTACALASMVKFAKQNGVSQANARITGVNPSPGLAQAKIQ